MSGPLGGIFLTHTVRLNDNCCVHDGVILLCVFRQVADTGGSGTVLLHQPRMSDGWQHGRQRGDAHRRRTMVSFLFAFLPFCVLH